MWLLMAIVLNLQITPISIEHGEVIEIFGSKRECLAAQVERIKEYEPVPPELNLGCVPLNSVNRT
jgi:hypothetical protein